MSNTRIRDPPLVVEEEQSIPGVPEHMVSDYQCGVNVLAGSSIDHTEIEGVCWTLVLIFV